MNLSGNYKKKITGKKISACNVKSGPKTRQNAQVFLGSFWDLPLAFFLHIFYVSFYASWLGLLLAECGRKIYGLHVKEWSEKTFYALIGSSWTYKNSIQKRCGTIGSSRAEMGMMNDISDLQKMLEKTHYYTILHTGL